MPTRVAIIDYGMGNLRSVANAVRALGATSDVTAEPASLAAADRIVLPGVGAFGDAMRRLRERGFVEALEEQVRVRQKPFLGICLGLQLLATTGTEHGEQRGLGWIDGTADRLPASPGVRVPHIGWNTARFTAGAALYAGLDGEADFYFVHSYALRPRDPKVVTAVCSHGEDFAASVEQGNLHATQFHPEKSQRAGLAVLQRFLSL